MKKQIITKACGANGDSTDPETKKDLRDSELRKGRVWCWYEGRADHDADTFSEAIKYYHTFVLQSNRNSFVWMDNITFGLSFPFNAFLIFWVFKQEPGLVY